MSEILVPRRRPSQARSRERFHRILQAARAVLVDVGFESFTFDEVARRAEVPIGTIYQFFANKYAMICERDRGDTAETVGALRSFSAQIPAPQWPEVLEGFIDHLAHMWSEDPSRRAVWHAIQSTPATRATAADTQQEMLAIIAQALRPLAPEMGETARHEMAGLLVHTVVSLMNFGVQSDDAKAFFRTVDETKRMLVAYLFSVATL